MVRSHIAQPAIKEGFVHENKIKVLRGGKSKRGTRVRCDNGPFQIWVRSRRESWRLSKSAEAAGDS